MLYVCICAIYIESERTELLFPFLSLNPFGIFKNDCKAIRRKWKKKKTKPEKKNKETSISLSVTIFIVQLF